MERVNGGLRQELEELIAMRADIAVLQTTLNTIGTRLNSIDENLEGGGAITIHPWFYDTITQGTFNSVVSSNHYLNAQLYNSPSANGDQVNYKEYLRAGTYTFTLVHVKASAYGIVKMLIDGEEEAVIDCYGTMGPPAAFNNMDRTTVEITTSGFKTISLKIDGKNPSSSGYVMNIEGLLFRKTA